MSIGAWVVHVQADLLFDHIEYALRDFLGASVVPGASRNRKHQASRVREVIDFLVEQVAHIAWVSGNQLKRLEPGYKEEITFLAALSPKPPNGLRVSGLTPLWDRPATLRKRMVEPEQSGGLAVAAAFAA